MDKIILRGIRFHGYHGVDEAERRLGQKYEVDADLMRDVSAAGQTDDLHQTIDYAAVVRCIVETGTQRSFQLFEALAETFAAEILSKFPVEEVRVVVKKLSPPIEPPLDYAGVEIHRKKQG